MDRTRFSHIAHRNMDFCSPIGGSRVATAITRMCLAPESVIVDFGAGKCGWLAQILRVVPGARGIGIEPARLFADEARRRHADLIHSERLEIVESSATDFLQHQSLRCDAALCIGSTHAFGGFEPTLDQASKLVKSGGTLTVADGYWKKTPIPEYLAVLGSDESEFTTHSGNIKRALSRGLHPRWACTVTDDEWDDYEWSYSHAIESFVRDHPDDLDAAAMLKRSRGWREAYVKWGRDTLGFGLYILEVP